MGRNDNTKLSSVEILQELLDAFKIASVHNRTSLKKVVNRSLYLYINSDEFRKSVNCCTALSISGSL